MFRSGKAGIVNNTYRGPVIYFGGSFSSLYESWAEWLDKFESLLRQLYWEHAVVVLVTEWMGQHVYRWDVEDQASLTELPPPERKWVFTGGPRDFR
jgi:hypothetical protein